MHTHFKTETGNCLGFAEVAQRIRAQPVLPQDPDEIPSTHLYMHSHTHTHAHNHTDTYTQINTHNLLRCEVTREGPSPGPASTTTKQNVKRNMKTEGTFSLCRPVYSSTTGTL